MTNIEMAKELREAMMLYTAVHGKEVGSKSKEIYEKCIQILEALDCGDLISKKDAVDKAIPRDFIHKLITAPENAGGKSRVLSWLLRKWEEEQTNDWNEQ